MFDEVNIAPENHAEIVELIGDRKNLLNYYFDVCNNTKEEKEKFTKKTRIIIGEDALFDLNQDILLSSEEMKQETGNIGFDCSIDSCYCLRIEDLEKKELLALLEEREYYLIAEFF